MTHYHPPPGFALVWGRSKYHLVRDGQYKALCVIGRHFGASEKRVHTEILSYRLCKLCKRIAELEAT